MPKLWGAEVITLNMEGRYIKGVSELDANLTASVKFA